jgi:hypothetical protein
MSKMFLQSLMFYFLILPGTKLSAQENKDIYARQQKFSVAIFAGEYGYDVGIGAEIGFPQFYASRLSIRLKGNINWLEQYKANFDHWQKYRSINASLIYNFIRVERCRVFTEAGPIIIVAEKNFSTKRLYNGATASIGVEMFVLNYSSLDVCYYASLGAAYSGAIADKMESHPKYGNGLVFNNGFRFYF